MVGRAEDGDIATFDAATGAHVGSSPPSQNKQIDAVSADLHELVEQSPHAESVVEATTGSVLVSYPKDNTSGIALNPIVVDPAAPNIVYQPSQQGSLAMLDWSQLGRRGFLTAVSVKRVDFQPSSLAPDTASGHERCRRPQPPRSGLRRAAGSRAGLRQPVRLHGDPLRPQHHDPRPATEPYDPNVDVGSLRMHRSLRYQLRVHRNPETRTCRTRMPERHQHVSPGDAAIVGSEQSTVDTAMAEDLPDGEPARP